MRNNLIRLRERALNQPLLLEASTAKVITGALQGRFGIRSLDVDGEVMSAEDLRQEASMYIAGNAKTNDMPCQVIGSTAVVPVEGTLVNKTGYLRPYSGMTGYDGIRANIDLAIKNEDIDHVVLHLDSGGGEVSGCFDLCDYIKQATDKIKITALVDDRACSACYAIASSCSEILISETSVIGSIGVITIHTSYEKAIEDQGIEVTIIKAGASKADMNPYEKLPKEVLARVQSNLNLIWDMFASRVASARSMSEEAIKSLEALTYMGASAIEVGLADRIVSPNDYLNGLLSLSGSRDSTTLLEGQNMTVQSGTPEKVEANANAKADTENATVDVAKVTAEASEAERTRIQSILCSDEAKGRTEMAEYLAFDKEMSSMSAEKAIGLLGKSPKVEVAEVAVEAEDQGADFKAVMAEETAEEIGLDSNEADESAKDPSSIEFAVNAFKQY